MTGFVNLINTANQSIDHNKKLPANLAGKSHCDTVESIKTKPSDAMAMQCLLCGGEGQSLSREESREV